jgi:hypothetical protein
MSDQPRRSLRGRHLSAVRGKLVVAQTSGCGANLRRSCCRESGRRDWDKARSCGPLVELASFLNQLDFVRDLLEAAPPPGACGADLTCFVPETAEPISVDVQPRQSTTGARG